MNKKSRIPVSKGQQLEIKIEELNHQGEGVGRHEGFTIFVPQTVPGDEIISRVISVQKNYARAVVENLVSASPHRIVPVCEHFEKCGGCQLQHLDYAEQLKYKQKIVYNALKRIGGLDVTVLPVIGMASPWQYRNKAQVPIGTVNGKVQAGFFEKGSHNIVDLNNCHIQHPVNDQVVHTVRKLLQELKISVYNENAHRGLVRHIVARTSFATGEVLVIIVTNGRELPETKKLITALRANINNLVGIVQSINTRRGNAILGQEEKTLWGQPYLIEKLGSLTFRLSPRSFFQVNPQQTEILYQKAKEYAKLQGQETVFDLYCGIGSIALFVADVAAKVIGVEIVESAVEDARQNAKLNDISNVEFHTGAAEEVVPRLYQQGYKADVVLVDPPRKGCDDRLLKTMAAMQPERIVYISCNPATLARDLKYLTAHGFTVIEVQPVDMFPQTAHVETVVLMSRK
ncbi:MAG: 23S rRNA (uracil(1939)-C(5))-methyltransferase RlmD [Clostridia bacterium]|nr:23S rRNA (uracil(1939)-C(5))-methyltransferase RlmD [Clostridia bacterium]